MRFKYIGTLVLAAFALFSCTKENAEPSDPVFPIHYEEGPLLTGKVCDESGSPVVDAVVTDGYVHAKTGADGQYSITSPYPAKVTYVSVSVPAGYEVLNKNGQSVFFCAVPAYAGMERKADIVLKKNDASQNDFTLMMLADTQVKPFELETASEFRAYASRDICEDLFADLANTASSVQGPCYGITLGDIANNKADVYSQYRLGMSKVGIPFFNVIGNHDHMVYDFDSEDESTASFESAFGPKNYSFNLGAFHFVVLDNCLYVKGSFEYPVSYGLEDWQVTWLKEDLSYVPKDTPVMVCMHSNLIDENGAVTGEKYFNTDKFVDAIKGYDKVYVWMGHVHKGKQLGPLSGLPGVEAHVIARSTGILESNEAVCADGTPRGYVILKAKGKDLQWQFHPTSVRTAPFRGGQKPELKWDAPLPADGQMRVYPRGSYGDNCVYANIFLWDNLWQMPVLKIGGKSYEMTKDKCYDLAYREIAKYYWKQGNPVSKIENYATSYIHHHFYVKVPSDATGMGTIEVVDRFGKTWQAPVSVDPVKYDDGMLHETKDFSASPRDVSTYVTESKFGYALESVSIHPFGNNGSCRNVTVVDKEGKVVKGGEQLSLYGNCTDTWVLEGTAEAAKYHFIVEGGALLCDEIILHYRKLVSEGMGSNTQNFVVDDINDIQF